MRIRLAAALFAATSFTACSSDQEPARAAELFATFQSALQRGDREACRELLTAASVPALDELPWALIRERKPLAVLGAERGAGDFRIRVKDPNDGGHESQFIVVREYGRLVVDLVATAGLHTEVIEAADAREELAPRQLTDADYARIRQHQLAQPPR